MMIDTVLIVDDSLTVRLDLKAAFEDAGFQTVLCATVAAARQAFVDAAVCLVVLDVLLPDGNGVDFLKELRASADTYSVVVLMLSTETEVTDRLRGLHTGADEYVGKPYDIHYVVARARELLRARRAVLKTGGPSTILVIDDSLTFREALRQLLEGAGYTVQVAASGEEGLRIAAAQRPEAIVVDSVLPGIDGATLIRRLRLDSGLRSVPCLLLTGSEDADFELRALEAGADAFVRKDEDPEVVLARAAAVLRGASTSVADITASLHGPKRVLAVHDNAPYLAEVSAKLREEGYDVVPVRSGEEAQVRAARKLAGSRAELLLMLEQKNQALHAANNELESQQLEIAQTNRELVSANQAKSEFLSTVSHEMRTPLNAIIGFTDLLIDGKAGELAPRQREYAGYIGESGTHLLALINDILDLSKIEAGKVDLDLEAVACAEVLYNFGGSADAPSLAQ